MIILHESKPMKPVSLYSLNPEIRNLVYEEFHKFGFTYVSLDLKGYRTGSMNEFYASSSELSYGKGIR